MAPYGYAFGDEAVHAFAGLSAKSRQRVMHFCGYLARYPRLVGDYQESGRSGRIYELTLIDDLLITWWADHAEREIRIIRLERID